MADIRRHSDDLTSPFRNDPEESSYLISAPSTGLQTSPQPPQTSLNPLRPDVAPKDAYFENLWSKYSESLKRNNLPYEKALIMLLEEVDSAGQTEEFLKWAAQRSKHDSSRVSISDFRTQLANIDWRETRSADHLYDSKLLSSKLDQKNDLIPLGIFSDSWLALRVDSAALTLKEADLAITDSYNVTTVNPFIVLGARYTPISQDMEKVTCLFAQLGKIFSTPIKDRHSDPSLEEGKWNDTDFVLALEVLDSRSTGKLYVISNLTLLDDWEELSDEQISRDPSRLLDFCREEPSFSVAQIKGQDLSLLKDSWQKVREENEEIQLEVLSNLKPELVETGLVRDGNDDRLVGLFDDRK